ncbi:hypothetical protein J3Q64DRAFT_1776513 [Phycomyces blakesleeanus]|uniref:Uncharacterized protein n=2 Tax=Phycomyces blakesleeanus TaxID=4837 RepID=A0A167JLM6_PHYB8|nr:hypothetical protein PHYBLDRAFT_71160 [Phycomyces blakesleeanus NRRL 1555(-)]OAD66257.1 hypothetical protein PHYBLDRAFT_71160 [Phycomyces blakesleeanus NRRL 1555(-)]|eukprot:XP_018284297.1 hypothetical protein PHYBLDRAFT_71160 [Phycomyces blakesleeanus NRRL 1555(-)]
MSKTVQSQDSDDALFQEPGLTNDIIRSIMTPGYTAKGVIKLMFYAFYALFATLAAMVVITGGNGHVIALLLLSLCLFFTIRWFVAEMEQIKKNEVVNKEEEPTPKKARKNKKRS